VRGVVEIDVGAAGRGDDALAVVVEIEHRMVAGRVDEPDMGLGAERAGAAMQQPGQRAQQRAGAKPAFHGIPPCAAAPPRPPRKRLSVPPIAPSLRIGPSDVKLCVKDRGRSAPRRPATLAVWEGATKPRSRTPTAERPLR